MRTIGIVAHGAEDFEISDCVGIGLETFADLTLAKRFKVARNVILTTDRIKDLVLRFPELRAAETETINEVAEILATASVIKNDPIQNEDLLRKSRLGEFLKRQRFVEWAALAAALAGLVV